MILLLLSDIEQYCGLIAVLQKEADNDGWALQWNGIRLLWNADRLLCVILASMTASMTYYWQWRRIRIVWWWQPTNDPVDIIRWRGNDYDGPYSFILLLTDNCVKLKKPVIDYYWCLLTVIFYYDIIVLVLILWPFLSPVLYIDIHCDLTLL